MMEKNILSNVSYRFYGPNCSEGQTSGSWPVEGDRAPCGFFSFRNKK